MNKSRALKLITAVKGNTTVTRIQVVSGGTQKTNLHLVGLGGGGSNALEYIYQWGLQAQYTCITSAGRKQFPEHIRHIPYKLPDNVRDSINESANQAKNMLTFDHLPDAIKQVFKPNDYFCLMVGLGGYTGSFLMNAITRYLDNTRKYDVIGSFPFRFEGSRTKEKALQFARYGKRFHYFSMEELIQQNGNISIGTAFKMADKKHFSCLRMLL